MVTLIHLSSVEKPFSDCMHVNCNTPIHTSLIITYYSMRIFYIVSSINKTKTKTASDGILMMLKENWSFPRGFHLPTWVPFARHSCPLSFAIKKIRRSIFGRAFSIFVSYIFHLFLCQRKLCARRVSQSLILLRRTPNLKRII